MSRPAVEVADIIRAQGSRFLDKYQSSFGYQTLKVFRALQNCRTAALGGHLDACLECGYRQAISYNSCRNRHCPKCQAQARQRWLRARQREVLPTNYFHVVFSVPHELNVFALENPRAFYDLLFRASTAAALEMAANPERLGAEIGMIAILHTWGQNLLLHPHIHCVISCRWAFAGSPTLDLPALSFLLTRQSPESCLSRQVPRRFETSPSTQEATVCRPGCCPRRPTTVRKIAPSFTSPRLGGLRQARFRRSHAGVALSRSLHPSRGHLQSSLVGLRTRARYLPLEGLRPRWQARSDDTGCHRVLAPLLSARATQKLRPHPSLRLSGQSFSSFPFGVGPTTAGLQLLDRARH